MPNVRALRRTRGLTFAELALESGIPARMLAEIEYGLRPLDPGLRARLAAIFGELPEQLSAGALSRTIGARHRTHEALPLLLLTLAGAVVAGPILDAVQQRPPLLRTAAAQIQRLPTEQKPALVRRLAQALDARPTEIPTEAAPTSPPPTPTPEPTMTPTAAPTSPPAFTFGPDGPHGCPLDPAAGRIVITQGYGVGTHAPAAVWGALDLAIDGDGDGAADPGTTAGAVVRATHTGVAAVFPQSWPGGNVVILESDQPGWATLYAHLDQITVAAGQAVTAGDQVGTTGSTGFSTGPHLHYEVRHDGVNLDPAGLIGCER